jgi:hypothetical protein
LWKRVKTSDRVTQRLETSFDDQEHDCAKPSELLTGTTFVEFDMEIIDFSRPTMNNLCYRFDEERFIHQVIGFDTNPGVSMLVGGFSESFLNRSVRE